MPNIASGLEEDIDLTVRRVDYPNSVGNVLPNY